MTRYQISIDEIVLDGLGVADVASFRAALAEALTRLAGDHSGEWSGGGAPLLWGAPVRAGAASLGEAVAGSVWRAIAPDAGAAGGGPS